jgi:hypothetical protein
MLRPKDDSPVDIFFPEAAMATAPSKPAPVTRSEAAAPAPRVPPPQAGSTPTPTPAENDAFMTQMAAGTLPRPPWFHKPDGSPIDPKCSIDPSPPGSPTWP